MNEHINIGAIERLVKEIEKRDLERWAGKPDRFSAYINDTQVKTTGPGAVIGTVIRKHTYKNNLGKTISTIRVQGTNGCNYYGSYGSELGSTCKLIKARSPFQQRWKGAKCPGSQ